MSTDNDKLTITSFREMWKKELLPELQEEWKAEWKVVKQDVSIIREQVSEIAERLDKIERSQAFISEKYDKLLEAIQITKKQIQSIEQKSRDHEENLGRLRVQYYDNSVTLDDVQQYLRRDCLEVVGIPKLPIDKPSELIKELCDKLNVKLDSDDISTAHRLPDSKKTKDRIIIKLVRREKREEIYKSRSKLIGKSTSMLPSVNAEIGKSIGSANRIHINESLTGYRKNLFGRIHAFKKDRKFKYLWTSNGRIHIREADDSEIFTFVTDEQFEKFTKRYTK